MRAADLRWPWLLLRAVRAAFSAGWLVRRRFRLPFDRVVEELRTGAPMRGALADPLLHLRVVNRLLAVLPPFGMGRCMKRSLLLLHLWSRCGLAPCLHLGVGHLSSAGRSSHAWLTAGVPGGEMMAGAPDGHAEVVVL